ncbi:MAG: hypothetical protein II838_00190 [Lachnospiraceae bacterium]|nr:hypothetical protein [Lachnospiraceae bacterium]
MATAKKEELKPKSFRIKEETANRIKEIANELGSNQQECLSRLIECYELQSAKSVMVGKKDEIEKFDGYLNAISRMFTGSLEDIQLTTDRVRNEYEAQLLAKDEKIAELESQIDKVKLADAEAVEDEKQVAASKIEALEKEIEELKATLEKERKETEQQEAGIKEEIDKYKSLCEVKIQKLKVQMEQKHMEEIEQMKKDYEQEIGCYRAANATLLNKYELLFQRLK